ncbi:MAG: septum formation initiator family protein [Candidatus Methylomirabilis oxygeniifera]|uniref:Putative Septum formation initiator (FtsB) n=1 Tax=Methylomirabilis oxygeniifera TaxID=671143 RepID=D5MJF0_METO1|nr:MAG: septum formation initiator family protein [Candidatus Methylomirabilis oxyfera]CBE69535.1 putative Septum formation initiator (ftsB) [Candidatus Methylomirabilis oxyfera]
MRKQTGPVLTGTQEEITAAKSSRKRWLVFLAGLAILIAVASVVGKKSFVKVLQMSKTRTELQQEITRLKQVNEGLTREIRSFANNPSQVEAIAREDLGLVKPGEIVYQFGQPRPSTALPASSR